MNCLFHCGNVKLFDSGIIFARLSHTAKIISTCHAAFDKFKAVFEANPQFVMMVPHLFMAEAIRVFLELSI